MLHGSLLASYGRRLTLWAVLCWPVAGSATDTWVYRQESDRVNNRTYSIAVSATPRRGPYDDIKLEIVCADNQLQATVNAADLIASQNSPFDMEYQIDNRPVAQLHMRTVADSKRRGYTQELAAPFAEAIASGQDAIFIRIPTLLRVTLTSIIPLQNANKTIRQVLSDCNLSSQSGTAPGYALTDFERDFSRLSPTKQAQVLEKIKKIIMDAQ